VNGTSDLVRPAPGAPPPASIALALLRFVHRLRAAGVPVSMVEAVDAVESVRYVDLADRAQLRSALAATMVKRPEHDATFDALFEAYFAVRRELGEPGEGPGTLDVVTSLDRPGDGDGRPGEGRETGDPSTELLEALLEALRADDTEALEALARMAVDRHGGMASQAEASERYYLYRVLRRLELSELLRRAMLRYREEHEEGSRLDERLAREELTERIEAFRRLLAREVRRRMVDRLQAASAASTVLDRPIEDVDFLSASPTELREMREAIRPLAQKLAARIARRRRVRRHGRLDVRRTVRRSLSAGGVPLDPAFRYRRASKPDLYLLCDISGSVAEFARFTMSLLFATKQEFARIRLFVFVDGVDEVTDVVDEQATWLAPRNLLYRTKAISGDGHSDYGNVFRRFWHTYGYADLDPRATVIITGDARNNYREAGAETLRLIHERARKVYWLNPEPRREWDTTDSIVGTYGPACHGVFEARNLRQLAEFVYTIT
jgi:uncharacterized protein with von Willebrand factor type A (vWA) domain